MIKIAIPEREKQLTILQKKYPMLEKIMDASLIITTLSYPLTAYKAAAIRQKFYDLEEILKELKEET